uniref:DDE Tnp4 domain-containing protein n=1 Tax=Knipowitschia caucasica TaxID=637954 RepID=A0AAV2L1Q7_KNICA
MADIDAVSNGFAELAGTPLLNKAVGAIDGCHVRIKPPSLHRLDYLNYKGSVHDTRILKNSSFYLARRYPPTGYFILGDGGYPCLEGPIALITPYREPVNGRAQRKFNYHLSRARSSVERAFGIMKTRWRSTLFRALEGCYGERMKRTGLVKREDCLRMELEKQTGSMVQRRQSPTEYPHWGSRQD